MVRERLRNDSVVNAAVFDAPRMAKKRHIDDNRDDVHVDGETVPGPVEVVVVVGGIVVGIVVRTVVAVVAISSLGHAMCVESLIS